MDQRTDSPPTEPDAKAWVRKNEPLPSLYIPLRKQQQQLRGHFVNLETGSNEDSDSEMVRWIEDGQEDLGSGTVKGARQEFQWPSKNSLYSLGPGQM